MVSILILSKYTGQCSELYMLSKNFQTKRNSSKFSKSNEIVSYFDSKRTVHIAHVRRVFHSISFGLPLYTALTVLFDPIQGAYASSLVGLVNGELHCSEPVQLRTTILTVPPLTKKEKNPDPLRGLHKYSYSKSSLNIRFANAIFWIYGGTA